MSYEQFDVILVDLNPVKGSEQAGIRPCIVISNSIVNKFARTCVVAIISSVIKHYPHTLVIEPSKKNCLSVQSRIDFLQIRTIDYTRVNKKLGILDEKYHDPARQCMRIAFGL